MKNRSPCFALLGLAAAGASVVQAAAPAPTPKTEKKALRVLAAPDAERRVIFQHGERTPHEMETVAFLEVETSSVSATTATQLGLPRGTGLVVNHLVPKSPAAAVAAP